MNKYSTAINGTACPARASGNYVKCGQMGKNVSEANHVRLRAKNRDCKKRQESEYVTTHSQEPRERPFSTVSTSNVAPHSHQRRWSAEICKCGTSPVITVRKNRKEPQPPHRGVSLLQPHTTPHYSSKRYSCPPIGIFSSPSSSSSSSSTSSCSSPPPVQTSVITGPDPLGWKLRPKTSPRANMNRLSLQIPLPVIFPESKSSPATDSQSEYTPNTGPSPKTKPPFRPKPPSRRHSDSSAFLRSLPTPLPVVTLEELCAVHLRPLTLLDESDDVFSEEVTTRMRKIPPPVPEKTSMARQKAQLMAHSHQGCRPVTANEEIIYTRLIKPKPKHSLQTEDHSRLHFKSTGLRVDTSCDRERSTPRFPGWRVWEETPLTSQHHWLPRTTDYNACTVCPGDETLCYICLILSFFTQRFKIKLKTHFYSRPPTKMTIVTSVLRVLPLSRTFLLNICCKYLFNFSLLCKYDFYMTLGVSSGFKCCFRACGATCLRRNKPCRCCNSCWLLIEIINQ